MALRRGFVCAVCCLLVCLGPVVGAASAASAGRAPVHAASAGPSAGADAVAGAPASTGGDGTIELTKTLSLTPDRPGEISVELAYAPTDNTIDIAVGLPSDATVTSTHGFSPDGGEYAWDGRTDAPTITYRLPVNETDTGGGPAAVGGGSQYQFVDAGPWALIGVPQVRTSWRWRSPGRVTLDRRTVVDGPGAVGDAIAYLGPERTYTRSAQGQRFRLVVPAAASLAESPDAIFDSLAAAADALRVGDRQPRVFLVAAPTPPGIRWAVDGLETGDSDAWVRDDARLDAPDNVWVHEYVHTRQAFEPDASLRWFTEASASYYAALLTLQQGRIDYAAFRNRLAAGERDGSGVVLSRPSTWDPTTPYRKGALVAGAIDRQTRLAVDGSTLQAAFRALNRRSGTASEADFEAALRAAGGDSVAASARRYVTTRATPRTWSYAEHQRAFRGAVARMVYSVPPGNASLSVSGPYRAGSIDAAGTVTLATGESLVIPVTVTNEGSAAGTYRAALTVDGTTERTRTGTLEPGASARLTFAQPFGWPGEFDVSVGGRTVRVAVGDPATPTVTGLSASDLSPAVGDRLTLTATVENDAAVPAAGNVTLTRNGTAVATKRVTLGPGERGTVAFSQAVDAPGTYAFAAANRSVTVTARAGDSAGTAGATGAGLGAGLAAVALALAAALLARRD